MVNWEHKLRSNDYGAIISKKKNTKKPKVRKYSNYEKRKYFLKNPQKNNNN